MNTMKMPLSCASRIHLLRVSLLPPNLPSETMNTNCIVSADLETRFLPLSATPTIVSSSEFKFVVV